ncbi:hypothetical protein QRX60_17490 [Amycolatopsis mongoliensis]|uniref:Glycine zipper domain-containing protein n=1 Tax=Amycolatopsis mongoliensis TaxID=715475 RepID=A0A9Y2NPG5_9PSEU|nr:hypothetical protein [Amycolatopsis sp. 4-36]WIY05550.1 hypothetical protein QRX60_17490 [Amycolatopsis sp. 4-36]
MKESKLQNEGVIVRSVVDGPGGVYRRRAALVALFAGAGVLASLVSGPVAQARDCQNVPHETVTAGAAGAGAGALVAGPVGALIGAGVGAIGSMVGGCTQVVNGTAHPAKR